MVSMPLLRGLPPRPRVSACRPAYPAILGALFAACHHGAEPPAPALAGSAAIAIAPLDASAPEDAVSIDARCEPSDAGVADASRRAHPAHRRVPRPQLDPAGY
jgi:hypothetical protein